MELANSDASQRWMNASRKAIRNCLPPVGVRPISISIMPSRFPTSWPTMCLTTILAMNVNRVREPRTGASSRC